MPDFVKAARHDLMNINATSDFAEMIAEGREWIKKRLHKVVEQIQMKQHHVHLFNIETNTRQPLAACRHTDNADHCKAYFPQSKWLVTEPATLCAGLLRQIGLRSTGKRCMLGSLHGPMKHYSIYDTHPCSAPMQLKCAVARSLP